MKLRRPATRVVLHTEYPARNVDAKMYAMAGNRGNIRMVELAIEHLEPAVIKGIGNTGLFQHHRANLPPSLIIDWDGDAHCFYLEGQHANRFFKIDMRNKTRGFLIRNPSITVDLESAYDAVEKWDPLGALVVANGNAYIVGCPFGDGFADPVRVPLWKAGMQGSQREAVGFRSWKLVLTEGDREIELWRQSQLPKLIDQLEAERVCRKSVDTGAPHSSPSAAPQ